MLNEDGTASLTSNNIEREVYVDTAGNLSLLESSMAMAVRTNPPNIAVESFEGVLIPNDDEDRPILFVVPPNGQGTTSIRLLNLGDADLTNMRVGVPPDSRGVFEIVQGLDSTTLGASGQVLITI